MRSHSPMDDRMHENRPPGPKVRKPTPWPALRWAWFVGILTGLAAPAPAASQTLLGRVLDLANDAPIGGVIVSLVTRDGTERVRTVSDSIGHFVIVPPEDGEYVLVADRFGYMEARSPLLALVIEGQTAIDMIMTPEPIGLEGLEISVEEVATEELKRMGLSANELGNRWISRQRIEAIPLKLDVGAILEKTNQSGIRVIRPGNDSAMGGADMGLCVAITRARTGGGRGTCALIVLNGIPIAGVQALDIDPESIESMALLEPMEATTFYGTIGGSGALLVWTKRGR